MDHQQPEEASCKGISELQRGHVIGGLSEVGAPRSAGKGYNISVPQPLTAPPPYSQHAAQQCRKRGEVRALRL